MVVLRGRGRDDVLATALIGCGRLSDTLSIAFQ